MHFLKKDGLPWRGAGLVLGEPRAAVRVRVEKMGEHLVIEPEDGRPFVVAKRDVEWAPLPERCSVVSEDGEVIRPSS